MEQELRFGPVGITETKIGPIMSNFGDWFFHVFMGKKYQEIKNIVEVS